MAFANMVPMFGTAQLHAGVVFGKAGGRDFLAGLYVPALRGELLGAIVVGRKYLSQTQRQAHA